MHKSILYNSHTRQGSLPSITCHRLSLLWLRGFLIHKGINSWKMLTLLMVTLPTHKRSYISKIINAMCWLPVGDSRGLALLVMPEIKISDKLPYLVILLNKSSPWHLNLIWWMKKASSWIISLTVGSTLARRIEVEYYVVNLLAKFFFTIHTSSKWILLSSWLVEAFKL